MAYSREDIDRVRAATNLLDLVGAVTTVKRQGRAFKAVCPFHQEKTPSLSLDPARGLLYCFGCQWKGDVFTFVEQTQGLSFQEAVELLARQAGIALTEDPAAAKRRGEREALVAAVRRAVEVYHRVLRSSPEAAAARSYLRGRGYDADTVDEWRLGYAPAGGQVLVKELRAAGIPDRVMLDAGLVRRGRGGLYDYFRERVLFPINDLRGDPVGFGGRILGDGTPKYLNTPETRLYQKSKLLYGLDRAKSGIARQGYSVVVEGYTDVIALHRAGLPLAVATCGTALGEEHFDLLRRFADRVVLAFDADAAGAGAALRGDELETPVRLDLDLRVAEMPPGVDPADLVQEGRTEELQRAVSAARPLLRFRIEKEAARFDLTDPEGRTRAVRAVAPLVGKVTDEVARTEYVRFAAGVVGVEIETMSRAVAGGEVAHRRRPTERPPSPRLTGPEKVERELLRAMLAGHPRLEGASIDEDSFVRPEHREAFRRVAPTWQATPPGEPVDLSGVGDDPVGSLLVALALDDRPLDDPAELVARVHRYAIERRIEELRRLLDRVPQGSEEHERTFRELIALEHEKRRSG